MQNSGAPKISVIVPVRNSGSTLRNALDSLFRQTYTSFEVIAVDGLSSDNTVDVLKSYGDRVQWISERDSGTSDAINKGFDRARGEFVTTLLADDYYPNSEVFARVVAAFDRDPKADALFGSIRRIDPEGLAPTVDFSSDGAALHRRVALQLPGAFFRRSALKSERFDPTYKIANDYEFVCRLVFGRALKYLVIPDINMIMSLGGMSGDRKNDFIKTREKFIIRRRYFGIGVAVTYGSVDYLIATLRKIHIRPFTWYRKTKRLFHLPA